MVTHQTHGLLVFVDAQPSEQIGGAPLETLVLAGLVCDQIEGLPGLRQFKDTPFKDRAPEARRLVAALSDGSLSLHTFSLAATFKAVEDYASVEAGNLATGLSNRFSVIFFRACREELLHLCFPAGQVQVLPAG